jgi:hypothetical protein
MQRLFTSPYDYGYHEVVVSCPSGRFSDVDISRNVAEISFFENITKPYITGNIIIADSSNISNHVNFMGQEYIDIKIFDPDKTKFLEKRFVVTGVTRQAKANDHSSVILLTFVEEHVIISEMTRFSRTYEGKPEQIISDILNDHLGVSVRSDTSSQDTLRYIAPYTHSPLQMIMEISKRATSVNGAPFYLYSSLHEDGLIFESLETMLGSTRVSDKVFNYSAGTGAAIDQEIDVTSRQIKTMSISNNESSTHLFKNNMYGAQYLWVDTSKDIPTELRYRFTEGISKMPKVNGTLNYDAQFTLNNKAYHEGVSSINSQIVTASLFDNINSLNEELITDDHLKKAQAKALRSLMAKTQMDITVPGYRFMQNQSIIGKMIDIFVPKNIAIENETSNIDRVSDKKLTGKYMIFGTRHYFKNTKYSVIMNITKYDNKKNLSQETVNAV